MENMHFLGTFWDFSWFLKDNMFINIFWARKWAWNLYTWVLQLILDSWTAMAALEVLVQCFYINLGLMAWISTSVQFAPKIQILNWMETSFYCWNRSCFWNNAYLIDIHWEMGIPEELPHTMASWKFRGTMPPTSSKDVEISLAGQQIYEPDLDIPVKFILIPKAP